MKRITKAQLSNARDIVKANVDRYEAESGIGPCGGLAILMARAGWGTLAMLECTSEPNRGDEYSWYPHYVVRAANGMILDISGEYAASDKPQLVYRDVESIEECDIIGSGPGFVYGQADLDFWQPLLSEVL